MTRFPDSNRPTQRCPYCNRVLEGNRIAMKLGFSLACNYNCEGWQSGQQQAGKDGDG